MSIMKIEAHAKVNLVLNVLGKRPDGYHEVEMLMKSIDLHDDIDINVSSGNGIWINSTGLPMVCNPSNIAFKAAELMKQTFDKTGHVTINIDKKIPVAGGLGGGSADAAAVINALASIWEIDDEDKLFEIGGSLGSDVPFMIAAGRGKGLAIARGTGTSLEYLEDQDIKVKLMPLDLHVRQKTAKVYKALKKEDYESRFDIQKFLEAKTLEEKDLLIGNHLEAPSKRVFQEETSAKGLELLGTKEDGFTWHMSGAGPTLFRITK